MSEVPSPILLRSCALCTHCDWLMLPQKNGDGVWVYFHDAFGRLSKCPNAGKQFRCATIEEVK